jgi:hypothetical protein
LQHNPFESLAFRASGLNLAVSAIILWNTVYLSRVVESFRAEGHNLPDDVIRHISPQIWEHITPAPAASDLVELTPAQFEAYFTGPSGA